MTNRKAPLTAAQRAVLQWVHDGCATGVYEDWAHRLVARALHNRGLLLVKGHGSSWTATITKEGVHYLETGTYFRRDDLRSASHADGKALKKIPRTPAPSTHRNSGPGAEEAAAKPQRKPVSRKPGPVDQLMRSLHDADDHRVLVPIEHAAKYRQLAATAKRFGRVPAGNRLGFESCQQESGYRLAITLGSQPGWQTKQLPQAMSEAPSDPSDVVLEIMQLDDFPVQGAQRNRAFRLLDALVRGARATGMAVSLQTERQTRGYAGRNSHANEIRFALDRDEAWLRFTQATLHVPHEPTERELKRARQGYMFPDFDEVPDKHLGIALSAASGRFWADSWKDTDEHRLEDDLVEILEEIRLRLGSRAIQRAAAEERQRQAELQRAERARHQAAAAERAAIAHREHLIDEEAKPSETLDRSRSAARLRGGSAPARVVAPCGASCSRAALGRQNYEGRRRDGSVSRPRGPPSRPRRTGRQRAVGLHGPVIFTSGDTTSVVGRTRSEQVSPTASTDGRRPDGNWLQ